MKTLLGTLFLLNISTKQKKKKKKRIAMDA